MRKHLLVAATAAALIVIALGLDAGVMAQPTRVESVAVGVPASRTDRGWNQMVVEGLERVGRARRIRVEVAENLGYGDVKPVFRDMARRNQLLICGTSGYQTLCPELAREVNVRVGIIDNTGAVGAGLISSMVTKGQEGAYLAGVLAGHLTQTGSVGIVAAGTPPGWNRMAVGFAEGLHAAKPDARLFYGLIGHPAFDDAAGALRITEALMGVGTDIVFGLGNGSSFGMMRALAERNKRPGPKAWLIDVVGDKRDVDKDNLLLTSVMYDFGVIYEQMIADIERGTFGKVYTMDGANKGIFLMDLPRWVPASASRAVERARGDIASGKVKVSDIPTAPEMMARLRALFPTVR